MKNAELLYNIYNLLNNNEVYMLNHNINNSMEREILKLINNPKNYYIELRMYQKKQIHI